MEPDIHMVELDAAGLKRLFSHGLRRMKTRSSTSEAYPKLDLCMYIYRHSSAKVIEISF